MRVPDDALRARILGGLRDLGCDADHPVRISELSRALRLVAPSDLRRLLLDLECSGVVVLSTERPEDADATRRGFRLRRGPLVLVWLARSGPSRPRETWPSLRERIVEKLAILGRHPGWRPVAWVRRMLPGTPREDLDRALVILELSGVLRLVAAPDAESLSPQVRRGALDGHDRGLLAYVDVKG